MGVYELFTCSHETVYTFGSFLALNSTHFTSEAPNLISTFLSMLIFIILSFFDWRRG